MINQFNIIMQNFIYVASTGQKRTTTPPTAGKSLRGICPLPEAHPPTHDLSRIRLNRFQNPATSLRERWALRPAPGLGARRGCPRNALRALPFQHPAARGACQESPQVWRNGGLGACQ